MSDPLVTVVITTRNRGDSAIRALESALAQSVKNIEVLVVDDASSPPIRLTQRDSRVRLVRREESRGVCAARNSGLAAARGQWITFLDDDDCLLPDMLKLSLAAAETSKLPPPVAVLSAIEVISSTGELIDTHRPVTSPRGKHWFLEGSGKETTYRATNTLVCPVRILNAIGCWDEELRAAEQSELLLRLNQECSIQGVDVPTYRKIRHEGLHLHANRLAYAQGMELAIKKHNEVFALHKRRYAHCLGAVGMGYHSAGRWIDAVRATTRAVIMRPTSSKLLRWWVLSLGGPITRGVRNRVREVNLSRTSASTQ